MLRILYHADMKHPVRTILPLSFFFLLALAIPGCRTLPGDPIADAEHARDPQSKVLLSALAEGTPREKVRAAAAMGRIQATPYLPALAGALQDESADVRHAALFALGQYGLVQNRHVPPAALAAVKPLLESEDEDSLVLAVQATGKLASMEDAPRLASFLSHASPRVREEAAHALMRLRFAPLWRKESVGPWPDGAVQALEQALTDKSGPVREAAAHAFSRYGEPRALDALAACSGDEDPLVRLHAVRAVGRSGKEAAPAGEKILWGLSDPDSRVRRETVTALAALSRQDLLPLTLAEDPAFHVRESFAAALAGDTRDETIHVLRSLETDSSRSVRTAAIGALAARLGEGYREDLAGHLGDPDWVLRAAAAAAAGSLGENGFPVLLAGAGDPDPRVGAAALAGMKEFLDREEAADAVRAALTSDDLAMRGTALDLLKEWPHADRFTLLSDLLERSRGVRWVELREGVADMLGSELNPADPSNLESPAARILAEAASDPAPSVRSKAQAALAKIDPGRTYPQPAEQEAPAPLPSRRFESNPVVVLETSKGTMEIECFPGDAPVHVANFVKLVENGFYDQRIWHRVVPNFVIQGGDPEGNGWGGPGYTIPDEINRRRYLTGTVGMPKGGKDTGGCQLFITHIPTPHLDGNYTVFGRVVSGLEVIDRIEVGDRIVRAFLKR